VTASNSLIGEVSGQEMSTLPEEVDCHLRPLSRLSGNEHLRLGTR